MQSNLIPLRSAIWMKVPLIYSALLWLRIWPLCDHRLKTAITYPVPKNPIIKSKIVYQ